MPPSFSPRPPEWASARRSTTWADYIIGDRLSEQDLQAAFDNFEVAAEQGHGKAQIFLGRMYFKGEGIAQDDVEAYHWFSIARVQEPKLAEKFLDRLSDRMSDEEITMAEERAANWRPN